MVIVHQMDTKGVKALAGPLDVLDIQPSEEGAYTIKVHFRVVTP